MLHPPGLEGDSEDTRVEAAHLGHPPASTPSGQQGPSYHTPLGCVLQGLDHFQPLFKPHLFNVVGPQAAEFLPARGDLVRSGGTTEQRAATATRACTRIHMAR